MVPITAPMLCVTHRIGIFEVAAHVNSTLSDLTCVCMFQVSIRLTTASGKVTVATYGRVVAAARSGRDAS